MRINTNLYKNEIQLEFDSFKHQYKYRGQIIPSVTTVLGIISKPQLVGWASRMCAESIASSWEPGKAYDELEIQAIIEAGKNSYYQKKIDAGTVGSFLHSFIEKFIKGENPGMPVNESLQKSVNQFLDWVKEHDVKFLVSEQQIFSKKYQYTGTLDFICTIDGKMYIGDLKTSNAIYYNSNGEQLMAYRMAREEEFPEEVFAGCLLIRIGKDGSFEQWIFEDGEVFKRGFLYALKLYETEEEIKRLYPKK